jgi:hypothetical protein
MKTVSYVSVVLLALVTGGAAQIIPSQLWGKWRIRNEVPTSTISCWSEAEAKAIIGTEIEYAADYFRWRNVITKHPAAEVREVEAEQFRVENSGEGASSSQVSFHQLGINAPKATQVTINHPPADVTGGTTEIPGDKVLLADRNTIIFSVCNVYFEAKRVTAPRKSTKSP